MHAVCELHVSSAGIIDAVCEQNNACDKQTICMHAKGSAVIMLSYCMYAFYQQLTAHVCSYFALILYACILLATNSTCLLLFCTHIVCMHFTSN